MCRGCSTNSHAIMRVVEGLPTAEPLIDALYVSAQSVCMLVSALCCAVASHQWRLSAFGGGASVAAPASDCDWTERHRSRIASSCLLLPGGMSDEDGVRAAFRTMLSAERAGYKLAMTLVSTLVSYLVGLAPN